MKWIVTANTNQCRIYNYHKTPEKLKLLKEIEHPENKLKTSELVSDQPGHYATAGTARGAFSQETDPDMVKRDEFARQLAHELEHEKNEQHYDELITIMPAEFEGMLFHHLNKQVKSRIKNNISKNLMHLSEHELLAYLHQHLKRI